MRAGAGARCELESAFHHTKVENMGRSPPTSISASQVLAVRVTKSKRWSEPVVPVVEVTAVMAPATRRAVSTMAPTFSTVPATPCHPA